MKSLDRHREEFVQFDYDVPREVQMSWEEYTCVPFVLMVWQCNFLGPRKGSLRCIC